MIERPMSALLLGSSILAAGGLAVPAHAQDAAAQAATPDTVVQDTPVTAASGGLEEIIVTARRRTESVQDIPVSVQAISAETIDRRDLTSLEKISAATPQFTVARSSNGAGAQMTLRGIGSSATSIGIEQSVAVVVDGVYYGQGRVINEGFFDLARVEILKGPQALFFGKNATAGVISLTTADPGPNRELIGRIGYEFGAEQLYGEAIASGPLTDTLGLRVALRGSKMFGGYYKNFATPASYLTIDAATGNRTTHIGAPSAKDQPQEREYIGRATLQFEPDDRLAITLKGSGSFNETVGNGWNYSPVKCPSGSTTLNPAYACDGGFDIHQNAIPATIAAVYPFSRDDGELYNTYKSLQGTGTITYELDNVNLTSITNYNWNNNKFACDCDFLGGNVWATENSSYRAFSQEVRALTSFDGPLNVMVGGLYQKTKRDFFQAVMFAAAENSAAAPEDRFVAYNKLSQTKGETLSAYGQAIWQILPELELTAGARYTHETKDSFFTQPYVNPTLVGIFRPQSAAVNGILFGDQQFNDWSPDATLSYKPNDDLLLYVGYRSAYKSGGFSNSAINSSLAANPARDLAFAPELGTGYEAGIKSTLLDNQLRANLVVYDFKYTDLQIDFFNSQIFAYITYNAGSAISRGAELELEYAPSAVPGLTFRGTLNYNKSEYRNFIGPCYNGQGIADGCSLVVAGVPQQDLNGVETAVAPKWTSTAGVSYEGDLSDTLTFGANVDVRYRGSYLGSSFGDPDTRQSSYAVLDAGLRIGSEDQRWQLALIGKNLTNKFYFTGGGTAPLTGAGTGTANPVRGDAIGYGAQPRTVRVQATFRY